MRMCIVTFRALRTLSVLVAAKHTTNVVVQKLQSLKLPKRVSFELQVKK